MLDLLLQKLVFDNLSRTDLMNYVPKNEKILRIGIYRNHAFEFIEHTIAPFLDFAGFRAEFIYSDYDDSLSFVNLDTSADLMILWLDLFRYHNENIEAFLSERIGYLKGIYKKPILAAFVGESGVYHSSIPVMPVQEVANSMKQAFWDLRMEPFSGTRISMKGMLELSKQLGLIYIPALIDSGLKAVILDLDHTLYHGVLGEDGWDGIELTQGHKKLQSVLAHLQKEGIFLCVISKNDQSDVLEMFDKRKDFLLRETDFSKISCSWRPKYESVSEIAAYLNIGTDSFLFIDDNPGELAEMERNFPEIKKLLASDDASKTADMLLSYPGLKKFSHTYEDNIRNADLKSVQHRKEMKQKLDHDTYLKYLHMKLTFCLDHVADAERISNLSRKTNQFIFNYKRYSKAEVEELIMDDHVSVVSVSLSDCLSESGIIAACIGRKEKDQILIEECFISCRALGRGIEDIIVKQAIQLVTERLQDKQLKVLFQKGERNMPAEQYMSEHLGEYLNKTEKWNYQYDGQFIDIIIRR